MMLFGELLNSCHSDIQTY